MKKSWEARVKAEYKYLEFGPGYRGGKRVVNCKGPLGSPLGYFKQIHQDGNWVWCPAPWCPVFTEKMNGELVKFHAELNKEYGRDADVTHRQYGATRGTTP